MRRAGPPPPRAGSASAGDPRIRVAVVTGASSGIGAATSRLLADRGWHCVLLARRAERLRLLAEELDGEYEVCDVGDRAAVDAAARRVRDRHPRIGLLVNNAGIPGRRGFLDAEPERIEEVARVNYLGSVWCLRAFLPALEAGAPSHVVNVVSVAGVIAVPRSGPYSAAKHAQAAFSRAVEPDLQVRGVAVHAVFPGLVETEGFPQRGRYGSVVDRLVVDPEDVARAIVGAVEHDRREVFVPWWYRVPVGLRALAPGLVARVLARARSRAAARRGAIVRK
jgi:short-subunit dehydrogenase